MKFIISIPNNNETELSKLRNVVERLNQLTSKGFFRVEDENIVAHSSSNSKIHNKIIAILILFFDQHNKEFSTYARIRMEHPVEFVLPSIESAKRIYFIDMIEKMLKGIKSIQDVEVKIEE